jgi:hypothetical protein
MLAGEARAAAQDWVARHAAPEPWFRGAYLAESAADRPADAVQSPWSDVYLTVVVAGARPRRSDPRLPPGAGGRNVHDRRLRPLTALTP